MNLNSSLESFHAFSLFLVYLSPLRTGNSNIYSVLQSYHTIKVENDKYIVKQDTIHYIKGTNYQLQEKLNLLLAIEKITRTDWNASKDI